MFPHDARDQDDRPLTSALSSLHESTIRFPHADSAGRDRVVRPALAILYRIAVGPRADRYVRRFLGFERAGHARPGWHWPSLFFPGVWAFYRKLWLLGALFVLLPVAGALAFTAIEPVFDQADVVWIACALAAVWLLPGVIPALLADSLLYGRVRDVVARAEHGARSASEAVHRLSKRAPTSIPAALLLGGGGLVAMTAVVVPPLVEAYTALAVRTQIAQALHAVRGLENEIEATWSTARLLPRQTHHAGIRAHDAAALIDEVHVHPRSGRIRIAFGGTVPALSGKTLLLAPARDMDNRWHWLCVPVDIPSRWLPAHCRQ